MSHAASFRAVLAAATLAASRTALAGLVPQIAPAPAVSPLLLAPPAVEDLVDITLAEAGAERPTFPVPRALARILPPLASRMIADPLGAPALVASFADQARASSGPELLEIVVRGFDASALSRSTIPSASWSLAGALADHANLPPGVVDGMTILAGALASVEPTLHAATDTVDLAAASRIFGERQRLQSLPSRLYPLFDERIAGRSSAEIRALPLDPAFWLGGFRALDGEDLALVDAVTRVRGTSDTTSAVVALRALSEAIDVAALLFVNPAAGFSAAALAGADPCLGPPAAPVYADRDLTIAVFGSEDNCHYDPCPAGATYCHPADNARIRIDLGGNDRYLGQTGFAVADAMAFADTVTAGGMPSAQQALAATKVKISIDVAGDDRYGDPAAPVELTQGAGVNGGVGIVADLSGNDTYVCGQRCQGYGELAGAGALLDATGADVYQATGLAQGAATLGAGLLADGEGADRYRAGGLAQGSGIGAGVLLDGTGNDEYVSPALSQGAGLLGAGVLVDGAGNDRYHTVGSSDASTFNQGFGLLGAGFLVDGAGDDRYSAGNVATLFAQGAAVLGAGALVDGAGVDRYAHDNLVTGFSQGSTMGLGATVLVDGHGNDFYAGGVFRIEGLLIAPVSVGYGQAAAMAIDLGLGLGPVAASAILTDRGGNDVYSSASFTHGALIGSGVAVLGDGAGDDVYMGGDMSQGFAVGPDFATRTFGAAFQQAGQHGSYESSDAFALLVDGLGDDVYMGGAEVASAAACESSARLYHGFADGSGVARLRDFGAGEDDYLTHGGTTPAANDVAWKRGCRNLRVAGSDTGEKQGGGKDD